MFSVIFSILFVMAAAGAAFLVSRFRKFMFVRRIAEKSKPLSWLAACAPVAAIACMFLVDGITWTVIVMHLVVVWLISDIVAFIVRKVRKIDRRRYISGAAALVFTAVYLSVGAFFAHYVFETGYELKTDKEIGGEGLRIVQISDAHLGATFDGETFAGYVQDIQALQPDVVVVTGDFVDDDSTRVDMLRACEALGDLETDHGVFFIFGNHDNGYFQSRDFTGEELCAALEANGVSVLQDEAVLIEDTYYIIGRNDRSARGRADMESLTDGIDRSKYMIVLDHQPNDYDAEAAAGVDLVLSGHTHGGHVFPAGLIGLMMDANDRVYGCERRGKTEFIVSSGISGWAIPLKTGTISEYVVIDVTGR